MKVLVVEDDPDLSLTIVWLLRSVDVDAVTMSPAEAMGTNHHPWDGAVVDLMMPDFWGVDVALHIKACGVPAVILTASGSPTHAAQVREAGLPMLLKPSSPHAILRALGLDDG